jgi:hypothetical protein
MDDDQGPPPVLPQYGQRDPKPAITIHEARALMLAFVNGKLLAESKIF